MVCPQADYIALAIKHFVSFELATQQKSKPFSYRNYNNKAVKRKDRSGIGNVATSSQGNL